MDRGRRLLGGGRRGGRIELHLAPGGETLDHRISRGRRPVRFIDADKGNYWNYYGRCCCVLAADRMDNTLWAGRALTRRARPHHRGDRVSTPA
jgi:predicted O-methyltransferase YrrM